MTVFVVAARLIPTGGAIGASTVTRPDTTSALLDRFKGTDRVLVGRARQHPLVGTTAPALSFRSFSGGLLEFDQPDRVVVMAFIGPNCLRCASAVQKLVTLSVVYYEGIYAIAVSAAGSAKAGAQTVLDVGGDGLVLGTEDLEDEVATALKVTKRPTLVVVGTTGTVDAVWTEDISLKVLYAFLKAAYDIDREG